jgi:hypothetical protein
MIRQHVFYVFAQVFKQLNLYLFIYKNKKKQKKKPLFLPAFTCPYFTAILYDKSRKNITPDLNPYNTQGPSHNDIYPACML